MRARSVPGSDIIEERSGALPVGEARRSSCVREGMKGGHRGHDTKSPDPLVSSHPVGGWNGRGSVSPVTIAVVTGGSRGIGYAVVRAFLKEGAEVVLCASRSETAERAVSQLKAELPEARVWGIWPSLEDPEQVRTAFDRIGAEHGRIDILVNNAGVSESTPFGAYTGELFDRVMDLNVKGMFHCARGAVPWMERQGRGVILNTSSMVSFYGQPAGVAYPVSKFAVNGFTLSLARELAPKGIRVNAVAPGIIETDMLRAVPREVLAPLEAQIPLGRVGQPGEVAEAFVFLASEQASYITGVVLRVDGLARA